MPLCCQALLALKRDMCSAHACCTDPWHRCGGRRQHPNNQHQPFHIPDVLHLLSSAPVLCAAIQNTDPQWATQHVVSYMCCMRSTQPPFSTKHAKQWPGTRSYIDTTGVVASHCTATQLGIAAIHCNATAAPPPKKSTQATQLHQQAFA